MGLWNTYDVQHVDKRPLTGVLGFISMASESLPRPSPSLGPVAPLTLESCHDHGELLLSEEVLIHAPGLEFS